MIKDLLLSSLDNFKDFRTLESKLTSINLIIELEARDDMFQSLMYKHIKIWMTYYLKSIVKKKFSYDEIYFEKVQKKISYIKNKNQQLKLLKHFIKLLNDFNLDDEIHPYIDYKKKLEIEVLFYNESFRKLLFKISIYNIYALILTLILSIFFFSIVFYFLQVQCHALSIPLTLYTHNVLSNFISNMIAYIFSINSDLKFDTLPELIFMTFVKIYFYILITYFIVKEISRKAEQL